MQDIFWGTVIIAVGRVMGGSISLGDFSLINIFFDGPGMIFISRDLVGMLRHCAR